MTEDRHHIQTNVIRQHTHTHTHTHTKAHTKAHNTFIIQHTHTHTQHATHTHTQRTIHNKQLRLCHENSIQRTSATDKGCNMKTNMYWRRCWWFTSIIVIVVDCSSTNFTLNSASIVDEGAFGAFPFLRTSNTTICSKRHITEEMLRYPETRTLLREFHTQDWSKISQHFDQKLFYRMRLGTLLKKRVSIY